MPDSIASFGWLNLTANGNVRPARVVQGVTGAGNALLAVEAATSGTLPALGITNESTRFPPGDPADDGYNAIAGEPLKIFTPGQEGIAVAGAAISNASLPLTYDNQGRVITVATSGGAQVWIVGYPTSTVANAGEKVGVMIVTPSQYTAPA